MYAMVDIETTGLVPAQSDILEIGITLLENDLTEIARYGSLVQPKYSREELERRLPDVVLQMHTKNGLIDDIYQLPALNYRMLSLEIAEFLAVNNATGLPMTGSTVSFDRAFLDYHMPDVTKLFHYRNIDISSMKILADMQGLGKPPAATSDHRVMNCIADSKSALEWFINECMVTPSPAPEPPQ